MELSYIGDDIEATEERMTSVLADDPELLDDMFISFHRDIDSTLSAYERDLKREYSQPEIRTKEASGDLTERLVDLEIMIDQKFANDPAEQEAQYEVLSREVEEVIRDVNDELDEIEGSI